MNAVARLGSLKSPDDEKLQELILFIAQRSEGDPLFGAVKLNKLLFYADFLAYATLGSAMTWHRYQKLKNGPAPRAMLPVLGKMESQGLIVQVDRSHFGKSQRRTIARRDANLSKFSADEIALVTDIIDHCRGKNAREMSLMSHKFAGWKLAEEGEDVPYEVMLARLEKPNQGELNRGLLSAPALDALAKEYLSSDVD